MGCVIDHLQADHRVRVVRDFSDARGTRCHADVTAILRRMDLDWARQEIIIEWEKDGATQTLYFALGAKDGPRNGRMRDYFEMGERVPDPSTRTDSRRRGKPATPPDLVEEPVTDAARYDEAAERVWALAARHRFEEAEAQIQLIVAAPDPYDGRLEQLAGHMVGIAVAHAEDTDAAVYEWARRRAVSLWYAWGSHATSGGEGAVRADRIRDAEDRLARCDALRG